MKINQLIFIDHNIIHVYGAADRFIILDRGEVVGEFLKDQISREELVKKMIQLHESGKIKVRLIMLVVYNSYFVKTHRLEISITIIAIVLFLIYFFGATHVFTRFPIYRAFMQSMPFFGIIAISATFVVTLVKLIYRFHLLLG